MISSGTRAGIENKSFRLCEQVERDAQALAESVRRHGLQEQGM